MHKVKIKPLKVLLIIWIAIAFCIILLCKIMVFSFFHLSSLNGLGEWKRYVIENINRATDSEPYIADYELINVVYDNLVVPYARARVTFDNDKKYSIDEIEDIAEEIAESADRIFIGKKSIVIVNPPEKIEGRVVIEVKKPCFSLFRFVLKKDREKYEAYKMLEEERDFLSRVSD